MEYERLDMVRELQLLERGKPTHTPAECIAGWALSRLTAGVATPKAKGDWLPFITKLHALEDPRG